MNSSDLGSVRSSKFILSVKIDCLKKRLVTTYLQILTFLRALVLLLTGMTMGHPVRLIETCRTAGLRHLGTRRTNSLARRW